MKRIVICFALPWAADPVVDKTIKALEQNKGNMEFMSGFISELKPTQVDIMEHAKVET